MAGCATPPPIRAPGTGGPSPDEVDPELGRLVSSTVTILALEEGLDGKQSVSREAQGSGFIIEVDGERVIVTARHVIDRATQIVVLHPSGARTRATALLAEDERSDVAVFEVAELPDEARPLQTAGMPKTGSDVVLVSSPLGLDQTLAFGTVAAMRNSQRAFQLAAGVSPGSSGGLVSDRQGRALGVIRAKASSEANAEDITWVTPMKFVKRSLVDAKRIKLAPAPDPTKMKDVEEHDHKSVQSDFFVHHPAAAVVELEAAETYRDHVCIDAGDDDFTVAIAESGEPKPYWRVARRRSCATFDSGVSFTVAVGTRRAGDDVTITVQR